MSDSQCTFCRIIAGDLPAHVIAEDELVIVFVSLENHPLVVTRVHFPDIYDLPDDVGAAVMAMASRVAKAVKISLGSDGVYLTQANGAAAGQDVFHFHLHVYPSWGDTVRNATGEFVRTVTAGTAVSEDARAATAEKVRQAL